MRSSALLDPLLRFIRGCHDSLFIHKRDEGLDERVNGFDPRDAGAGDRATSPTGSKRTSATGKVLTRRLA
jgi:hypothetical protein